ncbi:RDD family protein [Aquisalibacillus elongatus]|nr:RDD family protein [Aquisalibacillus elongatus]
MSKNIETNRMLAFIVDYFLMTLLGIILVLLILPFVSNDQFQVTSKVNTYLNLVVYLTPIFKDSFFKRSIGKRIFGLEIYDVQGNPLNYWQVLIRNVTLPILIVEVIILLSRSDRRRLGDLLGGTYVSYRGVHN